MFFSVYINGSHSTDVIAHDDTSSIKWACSASGKFAIIQEMTLVVNSIKRPLVPDANFERFHHFAADCFSFIEGCNFSDELWDHFHERLSVAYDHVDGRCMWTIPHQREVLEKCHQS